MRNQDQERGGVSGYPDADALARPVSELRGAPRFTLMLRVAKLVVDGREQFCVIRDASTTGLKVKLFGPLAQHRTLAVELANGDRHTVQCMWMTGDHAGLRFHEPIELERLIDEARGTGQRRQVRLRIALDAMLFSGGEAVPVAIRDISQQGAALDSEKWLLLNELVKIQTSILPALYAKVRWRDHPHYGVIFEQTFQLEELAHRCAGLPAPQQVVPESGAKRAN
ncbi:PilZ domain-containing protein [Novosphingobium sp.]|uniref:PilZ domain-containing protein n=1 Tax=Novosphingobium sp. TaxID=1874826 RepID=UPI003B51D391